MKFRGLAVAGMLFWCFAAQASDAGVALAQRSVCLACHQVDEKRVGPSFRDIALRYAGNEEAAAYLARSIREGSRGLWGAIPMPAQRHVDPATALLLGEWIVSLAPTVSGDEAESESEGLLDGEPGGAGSDPASVQPLTN